MNAELIKHAPQQIYGKIAEILNETAKTGICPKEINLGVLIPIKKPGKDKNKPDSYRPIILFSILRKILAIIILERIYERIVQHIPQSQAAYKKGRSTTEQILTMKILAERAINSKDNELTITLLDMSKAFDNINRENLMIDLSLILEPDELHIISLLINETILKVKSGNTLGLDIKTNKGVPQGDSISPVLFTLYLAKTLDKVKYNSNENINELESNFYYHNHKSIEDHNYNKVLKPEYCINEQYADDIAILSSNRNYQRKIVQEIEISLNDRDLNLNKDKTECY